MVKPIYEQADEAILLELLRQGSASTQAVAAVELLAEQGTWLSTEEFRCALSDAPPLRVDWVAFAQAVPGFPYERYSPSETATALIAAALACDRVQLGLSSTLILLNQSDRELVQRAIDRACGP